MDLGTAQVLTGCWHWWSEPKSATLASCLPHGAIRSLVPKNGLRARTSPDVQATPMPGQPGLVGISWVLKIPSVIPRCSQVWDPVIQFPPGSDCRTLFCRIHSMEPWFLTTLTLRFVERSSLERRDSGVKYIWETLKKKVKQLPLL